MKKFINLLLAFIIALAGYNFLYQPNKEEIKASLPLSVEAAHPKKDSVLKGQLKISVLNVGHGDAILLEGDGKTIMVDVGHSRNQDILLRKLAERGITRIDEIILTHHHQDHIGNILTIAQRYRPKLIYDSGMPNSEGVTSQKLEEAFRTGRYNRQILKAGDKVTFGDNYWIEVLAPGDYLDKRNYARVNNTSLVFRLHYGNFTMMFTGDTENPVEAAMAAKYGSQLKADVLKVAHHGSRTSSNYRFISRVKPEYALISCGDFEKYHHPNQNVIGALQHLGATIYTTNRDGDLTVTTDGNDFSVTTEITTEQQKQAA